MKTTTGSLAKIVNRAYRDSVICGAIGAAAGVGIALLIIHWIF